MVSALEWVLVGIVGYTVVVMALRAAEKLPDYVRGTGPIVTLHTQRGKRVLDRLARPKRLWRAWGNLGIGIAIVVMVGTLVVTLFSAYQSLVDPQPTPLTEPQNVLVIPGVNEFLPLSAAPEIIAGLVIALIVHEGGHGIFCRVADIDIDSMGLAFFSFIPVGAFVGPDEESVVKANRGDQTRMFVAGVTNNFAIGFLALLLLFGPVIGAFGVVAGVPVGDALPGGPAAQGGIDSGDVITGVEGQAVANNSEFRDALADAPATVTIQTKDGDSRTVERRLYVKAAATDAPVSRNQTITAVNGTAVRTSSGYVEAIRNRTVVRLSRAGGDDVTTPIGAYTRVRENGSLAAAGVEPGSVAIVTAADGERVYTWRNLESVIDDAEAGATIDLVAYVDGERRPLTVDLADAGRAELDLGVLKADGTSGFVVNDLGIDQYPAVTFIEMLGGDGNVDSQYDGYSFLLRAGLMLLLPFMGIAGLFNYSFPGFTGIATNFYTVEGPLAALGTGGAFLVANLLFWTAWVNLLVGQFNLFPTYPLDGGHILRTMTESVVARLPIEDGRRATTLITLAVSAIVLGSMAMLFIGPQLLA